MTSTQQRLSELGINLPPAPKAVGSYVPALVSGDLVFTAGQIPVVDGKLHCAGKVPDEIPLSDAQSAARTCLLNALAAMRKAAGSLEAVEQIVRLNVFVNSSAGFTDQAQVANAASDLLVEIFGPAGQHTRCTVGVSQLPLNAPVELDVVARLHLPTH